MSRTFSMATVARMIPNHLFEQFFQRLKNPCYGMDWKHRPRKNVGSILQCLSYFTQQQRECAELILRNVFELADGPGVVAIRNAARLFASAAREFRFGPDDVWSMFHSMSFDVSVWEIWGALSTGGRLVVVPYWVSRSPEDLYALVRDAQVTVFSQTPSAFVHL